MTWLVVGASGQLGKSVCEVLQSRGLNLISWDRNIGSASEESFVSSFVGKVQPKVIVNCAAWTDVDGAENNEIGAQLINMHAVGYLAKAAKLCDAKFAHVSTDYVFSGQREVPWSEGDEKHPLSVYGRTKAKGEDLINVIYPERSYIFRTAWLYSAYRKNFVKTMGSLAMKESGTVKVVSDQFGQPTFAGDLAGQIVDSVLANIPFGIYHATNSGQASWFQFAREIFRLVGADVSRVEPTGTDLFPRPAKRPFYSVLGHDKWLESGVKGMRNWKIALESAMPGIVSALKAEV
jgi:dTDP-4-dehydrorhamnose reductase